MDEVIKTNELPQVDALQAEDRILVDTNAAGTGAVPYGAMVEQVKGAMLPTMRTEAAAQLNAQESAEKGSVTITNNQVYPFNVGIATVALSTPRKNLDYIVSVEIAAAVGNVQAIEVYDKQLNGFKIRYDGSATSVTIKYYVTGGMQ